MTIATIMRAWTWAGSNKVVRLPCAALTIPTADDNVGLFLPASKQVTRMLMVLRASCYPRTRFQTGKQQDTAGCSDVDRRTAASFLGGSIRRT